MSGTNAMLADSVWVENLSRFIRSIRYFVDTLKGDPVDDQSE